MGVRHSLLTGAELHEPKGIENAPLDSVYAATTGQTGNWVAVDSVSSRGESVYGSMGFDGNTNILSLSPSATKVTGFILGNTVTGGFTVTDDGLDVTDAGKYLYTAVAQIRPDSTLGASNESVTFAVYLDGFPVGPPFNNTVTITRNSDNTDIFSVSNSQIIEITGPGNITLYATAPTNRDYVVTQATINLLRISL
jgi:hypothetical protein